MSSPHAAAAPDLSTLYDQDFFAWARRHAALLREGEYDADAFNLAEEVEDMGHNKYSALHNRIDLLLVHLLKRRYQPARRSRSWRDTIRIQRKAVQKLLDDNPSLRPKIAPNLSAWYKSAVPDAVFETNLPKTHFPAQCPFTIEQILDPEYLP